MTSSSVTGVWNHVTNRFQITIFVMYSLKFYLILWKKQKIPNWVALSAGALMFLIKWFFDVNNSHLVFFFWIDIILACFISISLLHTISPQGGVDSNDEASPNNMWWFSQQFSSHGTLNSSSPLHLKLV